MRKFVFGLLLALGLAIILVVGAMQGDDGDTKKKVSPPAASQSAAPSPGVAQSDPPELTEKKQAATRIATEFLTAYYSRDTELLKRSGDDRQEHYVERLRPYVTAEFLETFTPRLDTPQDDALALGGGNVTVKNVTIELGHPHEDNLEQEITVQYAVVRSKGAKPEVYSFPVTTYLVYESDNWKVEGIEEDYS